MARGGPWVVGADHGGSLHSLHRAFFLERHCALLVGWRLLSVGKGWTPLSEPQRIEEHTGGDIPALRNGLSQF